MLAVDHARRRALWRNDKTVYTAKPVPPHAPLSLDGDLPALALQLFYELT